MALRSTNSLAGLRRCVRPLVIDSGIPEAPLGLWGTCFVARHGDAFFAITAAHLVKGLHSGQVRVLLGDRSMQRLPLATGVGALIDSDAEETDIVVFPASLDDLPKKEARRAHTLNLTRQNTDWRASAHTSRWVVIGYPREHAEVDYDAGTVHTGQVMLLGDYLGPADGAMYLHRVKIANAVGLAEFAGFSGSPVFSLEHQLAAEPTIRFCGVALAGAASSEIIHFVEATRVMEVVHGAMSHVRRFGMEMASPIKGVTPNRPERRRRARGK